jgi:putative FmdB family regulatory protein
MPIYEYQCEACLEISAVLRSIGERDLSMACPICGGVTSFVLSSFSISHSEKSVVTKESRSTNSARGPTAVHIGPSGGATFKDCHFENFGTGISTPARANVDIDGCTFSNVECPVEIREE